MTLQSIERISSDSHPPTYSEQQRTIAVGLAVGNHAIKLSTAAKDYVVRSQSLDYHPDLLNGSNTLLLGEAITTDIFSGQACRW